MSTVIPEVINKNNKQTDTCDLLLNYLEQLGVEYVFGIPGGAIEPLYNALARSEKRGGIRAITARHETGAVFMADAYARNTGKLGVCCATTGPGATNMITGIASSYESNTPLLIITPQTNQVKEGKKALQDSSDTGVNIPGMLKFCTRYNSVVSHIEQFEPKLISAILTAFNTPQGPAHLSIPTNILKSTLPIPFKKTNFDNINKRRHLIDKYAIKNLIEEVSESKKIVFVIGPGAKNSTSSILRAINQLNAFFVTTPDAKGFINPYHPQYRGVIGFAGHSSAAKILCDESVDSVIAIGTTMGEFSSNAWDEKALLNSRLIHIDDNYENLARTMVAKLHVQGDIETIMEEFIKGLTTSSTDRIEAQYSQFKSIIDKRDLFSQKQHHSKQLLHYKLDDCDKVNDTSLPIKPQWLMNQLTKSFPSNSRYLADNGNNAAWAIHYLNPFDRRLGSRRTSNRDNTCRRNIGAGAFQVCAEFCSMGWSLGTAIGTALAHPSDPIICIVGDGSFLMSGLEITVAKQENLNVIFIIMNDQHLGMVKHGQQLNHAADIANELPNISYALMAASMGIMSHTIEHPDDFKKLNFNTICNRNGPTLLDVRIDPNEVPPIATRITGMN